MIGWLWRMLIGRFRNCDHHWEYQGRAQLYGESKDELVGMAVYLNCKNCGDWIVRNLR